ncbi:MAG: winged helix-turn-helix domain-containing protein [Planctomycetaceae bacterium]
MKKAEIKIGGKYYANVTNKRVEIQIDSEKSSGGWNATNLATGKRIHIKSAQRLQGAVPGRTGRAKVTSDDNVTVVENETAAAETVGSPAEGVPKRPRKAKVTEAEGEKKLSCIAAALKVLGESADPMNAKEMIDAMQSKGYWSSPGGKTPHATLYSAILRELAKGEESKFVKSERGRFTVKA